MNLKGWVAGKVLSIENTMGFVARTLWLCVPLEGLAEGLEKKVREES